LSKQAFQDWLKKECPDLPDNILGSALIESFKKAFEAGYEARRAEEVKSQEELWEEDDRLAQIATDWDYMNPDGVFSTRSDHLHRDNQDGTGFCLDCGQAHSTNVGKKETGNWIEGHRKRFPNVG
jgi:hypothetical protein